MPVTGRKAVDGPKRNRMSATHEWTDVADTLYAGKRPPLPAQRGRVVKIAGNADRYEKVTLQPLTRRWWKVVSRLPHAVLWNDGDWLFAVETALVADRVFAGEAGVTAELRHRERALGLTADARRDLRIRYVPPGESEAAPDERVTARVTRLADRRRRLGDDAP